MGGGGVGAPRHAPHRPRRTAGPQDRRTEDQEVI